MVPEFAQAALPAGTDALQDLGSQGSHKGNAARDIIAYASKALELKGELELYEARVNVKKNNKAVAGTVAMLLPHDLFSALGRRNALDKVMGPHSEHVRIWKSYLQAILFVAARSPHLRTVCFRTNIAGVGLHLPLVR